MICTPEYAGTLPGSFKNLLDWTVGGTEICDKPVAWVNAAVSGRGQGAESRLRLVLGYTGAAIVESACASIPVASQMIDTDGLITDPAVREQIRRCLPCWWKRTKRSQTSTGDSAGGHPEAEIG
ncbi:NADPH-dependent FMN reductase [Streptomyces sp. NPDC054840]